MNSHIQHVGLEVFVICEYRWWSSELLHKHNNPEDNHSYITCFIRHIKVKIDMNYAMYRLTKLDHKVINFQTNRMLQDYKISPTSSIWFSRSCVVVVSSWGPCSNKLLDECNVCSQLDHSS